MRAELKLPAISPEMAFVGEHWEEAVAVREGSIVVEPRVKKLTTEVLTVASKQFETLVEDLASSLEQSLEGLAKLSQWHYSSGDWGCWSPFRFARQTGKKTDKHFVGLYVAVGKAEKFRLLAYLGLRPGNEDSHRELARACEATFEDVHLPSDHKGRYPGWSNRYVIWYDQPLDSGPSMQKLEQGLHKRARAFLRLTKRLL